MKKLVLLITTIIIAFSFFLYFYLRPHDYLEEYQINNFKIKEEYHKKEQVYYFSINNKYDFIKKYKYKPTRKYINKISEKANCLTIKLINDEEVKICAENDINTLIFDSKPEKKATFYQGINIYNLNNYQYLVWDYQNIINVKKEQVINIFKNDAYDNDLFVQLEKYLIIPNLDNVYEFDEFIIYNLENNKIKKWQQKYIISDDSYILGTYQNNIYLVDRKNKKEYKINPLKEKIEIIGSTTKLGLIYLNGWKDISITKLVTNDLSFSFSKTYNYYLKDNTIYLKYLDKQIVTKIISDDKIKIYKINNMNIYYLKDDTLYLFNPTIGEIKLIQKFEWNFNYQNKIFIYE